MMERAFDLVRACAQLAWWEGCCVDLRLSRLAGLIDGLGETRPAPARDALATRT